MRYGVFLVALFSMGLTGCLIATPKHMQAKPIEGTTARSEQTATDLEDVLVCRTERPTGSHIPRKICLSRAMLERGTIIDVRRGYITLR